MAGTMNSLVSGDDPQGFWPQDGPVLTQGAGAIVGGMVAKNAEKGAMERSPEEAAALKGAMGSAGSMGQAGSSMLGESRPYMGQAASYYQTLLHGNRAAMAPATAGPRAEMNEKYRGAQANLAQRGVRGAARQQLSGDLARQQAGQVASLTTGVQGGAADSLAKLGTTMAQTATPLAGQAGSIYANLLNQGLENRKLAIGEGDKIGKPIGGLIADLGKVAFAGKKPGAPPVAPVPAPQGPGQGKVLTPPGGFTVPPTVPIGSGNVDYGDYGGGAYGDYGQPDEYGYYPD